MEKFQIDFTNIAEMFNQDKMPLKGNEHRIIRVAFDLFRIDGDETDDLWQVQADDDGNEFLVRTYSLPDEEKVSKSANWSVLPDKKYASLTFVFKGIPLMRIASKDYGAKSKEDTKTLQGIISRKLASDGMFVSKLLNSLPENKLYALKQAGLLDDIREWIEKQQEEEQEQESTDKFRPNVPFGNLSSDDNEWKLAFLDLHLKEAHCGQCGNNSNDFGKEGYDKLQELIDEISTPEQDADEEYKEMFDELLDSFKSKYDVDNLGDLPEDKKKEFFDEVDSRWTADNEINDSCLSSLKIPRLINKKSINGGKNG